jgi:hypothetical protein
MRKSGMALLSLFLAAFFFRCGGSGPKGRLYSFDLKEIAAGNNDIAVLGRGQGFRGRVLKIKPVEDNQRVVIWETGNVVDWSQARCLVCEMWHGNGYSGVVNVEFYAGGRGRDQADIQLGNNPEAERLRPRMTAKIGVLPGLRTKIVFRMEYLDGQNIFMKRFPRQLKATVLGNRADPGDITRIALRFEPFQDPFFTPEFEVAAVYLTDAEPEPYGKTDKPIVDQFGQWTVKEWPGKIHSEAELRALNESLLTLAENAEFPADWSRFGGWTKLNFGGTGFFRTHRDGNRWWLVDPDGFAFVSNGVDCIGTNASGVVENQEDLFAWLPDGSDPLFGAAVSGRRGLA